MGVKGLYTYLKHYRNEIDPREYFPQRIGIDAMSLLYRFKGATEELMDLIKGLRAAGHTLFFVFDGKPPEEKGREIQARKDMKQGAQTQAQSIEAFLKTEEAQKMDASARDILELKLQQCQVQSWHMTRELRHEFQKKLWDMEIPYVKSVSEADDVLVDLAAAGKIDVIMSTDMDYLLSCVPKLWIPTKRGVFHFEELMLSEILEGERLTREGLRDAGLLCGSEERAFTKGVPCQVAFVWMSHYGSLEALLKSNVRDPTMRKLFPGMEAVERARQTVAAHPSFSRMRPDHYERVKDFLHSL